MLNDDFRPTKWADYVGQSDVVERLRAALARTKTKETPAVLWIGGPSGAGKTTLAMLAAADVGATGWAVEELDGAGCTQAAVIELGRTIGIAPLGGCGWKAVVINEAHAMSEGAVQAWLTLLERLPPRRLVVFTSTERGAFGAFDVPFRRRCWQFELQPVADEAVAARLMAVANIERLPCTPAQAAALAKVCAGNLGMALARLDVGDFPPDARPITANTRQAADDILARLAVRR